MLISRTFILLALLGICPGTLLAQSDTNKAPLPEWVEEIPIEEFSKDHTGEFQYGVAYLLNDRQIRKTTEGYEFANRSTFRIIDRSGLDNFSTISHAFDSENATLSFNYVRIHRNGNVIDKLADAEITLLRQEEDLQNNIINGNMTAMLYLEDVRVGDVIDYSLSGSVVSRLWPNDFFEGVQVEWEVPMALSHFKFMLPEDMDMWTHTIATDLVPDTGIEDGWKFFQLHIRDPDPVPFEINVAADHAIHGSIMFSTMESWSDVVNWALPLFSFDDTLPEDFRQKLDNIRETYEKSEDQAIQALRLVQSDIRYLGLEAGLGSHVPRPPSVTLKRGFGDCKDKTVLLISALDYLDIEAVPALTSVMRGDFLPQLPPMIGAFDHVIVEISIDGRKIWVDPTLSHQGGTADNISDLDYGYILPVQLGQTELIALDQSIPLEPIFQIVETFEFPENSDVGLQVTMERKYRNVYADTVRYQISSLGSDVFARNFRDYYSSIYEITVESQPFTVHDDLQTNEIVFRAQYEADAVRINQAGISEEFPILAIAVQDILPRQIEVNRTAPLALPYAVNVSHIVNIVTPGLRFPLPEDYSAGTDGISYARSFRQDGEALVLEYQLQVTSKVAEVNEIRSVKNLADDIADSSQLTINLLMGAPALSRRLGLSTTMDTETAGSVAQINTLVAQEEFITALTLINTLLDTHTQENELRGALQLMKAVALVALNRGNTALEPFKQAFELYEPTTIDGYLHYFDTLTQFGQYEEAVELMSRILDKHPDVLENINNEVIRNFVGLLTRSGLMEQARALILDLAIVLHATQPPNLEEFRWVFFDALTILNITGDVSDVPQYLPYITEPRVITSILSNRNSIILWDVIEQYYEPGLSEVYERNVVLTQQAVDNNPDDFVAMTRHMDSLRSAGRSQVAVEFAESVAPSRAKIEAVGSDAYWFINEYAYALIDTGQVDEAMAQMNLLIDIGIAGDKELISMAINYAEMIMSLEDYEGAILAVEQMENLGDGYTSDYGMMWILSIKACSLYQLNRLTEAEAVLSESIAAISKTNQSAHSQTLLCLNRFDEAASVLVDRLNSPPSIQQNAIDTFIQMQDHEFTAPLMAELQERAEQVRSRPEVLDAFSEVGRVITVNGARTYWGDF